MGKALASTPVGPSAQGMYGIVAELKVFFARESDAKEPSVTLIGRIERHVEREVESLTVGDFLKRIQGTLRKMGMKRVIMMNKSDVNIYYCGQNNLGNWDEAFEAA